VKAIIIGGGIGGLTTAIALRKAGIEAEVYERAPELREVGAGIGLITYAIHALGALGLGEAIQSVALPGVQSGLWNQSGRELIAIPADEMTKGMGTVAVMHRAELLAELAREVDPQRLHLSHECVEFEQDERGVTAKFKNGDSAQGDVLIGADGLRSVVRSHMFGTLTPRYAGYTAWRAVLAFDHRRLIVGELWGRGKRFGIVPMLNGRAYWFATQNAPEAEGDVPGNRKPQLLGLFRGWHEPVEALIAATEESAILRNDIYDLDPIPQWCKGRTVLLGDAAHPMTPNLGQGACQAIADAVVLAVSLRKSSSIESGLAAYESRRIQQASQIVKWSRMVGAIGQRENPVVCWLRDTATSMTPRRVSERRMRELAEYKVLSEDERRMFA
jgi:2-polyprenyl-6-methoxyphenol hydroxylase-like FAD-dependent oxidoreductase